MDDENEGDSEHNNKQNVTAPKYKKKRFAYLFTEIPQQASELFVDAKLKQIDRRPRTYSEALPLAENLLTKLRQSRQRQFDELKVDIHIAFHDNLLGFGRAALPSEANRIRVKTQNNMQERMANLKLKEISLVSPSQMFETRTSLYILCVAFPKINFTYSSSSSSCKFLIYNPEGVHLDYS